MKKTEIENLTIKEFENALKQDNHNYIIKQFSNSENALQYFKDMAKNCNFENAEFLDSNLLRPIVDCANG